jgi:hypothetical protein
LVVKTISEPNGCYWEPIRSRLRVRRCNP